MNSEEEEANPGEQEREADCLMRNRPKQLKTCRRALPVTIKSRILATIPKALFKSLEQIFGRKIDGSASRFLGMSKQRRGIVEITTKTRPGRRFSGL